MQLLQYGLILLCNSPRRWCSCLQRQMVTQPPIELWPCPSMMVQPCTLDRTAACRATAFAGGIGSSLIYFYFYLILGYARHCFLKVGIQASSIFIMESKDLLHFRLTQGLNQNTAVNHATWFCRARTGNLWSQHLPLLVLLLQYRSQPVWDILQTCTMPAFPHSPVCCQSTSAGILTRSK